MLNRLWLGLTGWAVTALLAYPQLFYVHKYGIPWSGQNDFRSYHAMVLDPWRFDIAPVVFTLRQFTTLVAHGLLSLGVRFPVEIWFDHFLEFNGAVYRRDVFFSLLLTNFLGVCTAGGVIYAMAAQGDRWRRGVISPIGLATIMLLLLSGNTLFYALGPLTEGWSWAFAPLLLLLAEQRRLQAYLGLVLLLAVSIFQREMLLLVVAGWAVARIGWPYVLGQRLSRGEVRHWLLVLALACAAAGLYLALRSGHFFAVTDPYRHQWNPVGYWMSGRGMNRMRHFLHQWSMLAGLLKLNSFGLWLACALAALWYWRADKRLQVELLSLLTLAAGLFATALLTYITAVDRVVMFIAPLYMLSLARLGARWLGGAPEADGMKASQPGGL
jgi:hypothetical protein